MKKQYDGMKAEKVEFNYEDNVVAASNSNTSNCCFHFEGDLEILNDYIKKMKCPRPVCKWVHD